MTPPVDIAARLEAVRASVSAALIEAGRSDAVTIVAVSKTMPAVSIQKAYDAGQRVFGENRVQEAAAKIEHLSSQTPEARWHLIGTLQSNKAKTAVQTFSVIESVDSLRLAARINSLAEDLGYMVPVLFEINVAGEESKSGFSIDDFQRDVPTLAQFPFLEPRGLMTVAPLRSEVEEVRWVFRRLRELRDQTREQHLLPNFRELSMGMSNDFRIAIAEGATIVRIGRAIFGERDR